MTSSTLLPVLKQGSKAYFDAMRGPIPCVVETITTDQPADLRPGSFQHVTATVTEDSGCYRKGQKLEGWGLHFFPRKALGHGKHTLFIKPYRVQA